MVKHAGQKTAKHWYANAGPVEARQRNLTLMSFSCSDFLNPPGMDESTVLPAWAPPSHPLPPYRSYRLSKAHEYVKKSSSSGLRSRDLAFCFAEALSSNDSFILSGNKTCYHKSNTLAAAWRVAELSFTALKLVLMVLSPEALALDNSFFYLTRKTHSLKSCTLASTWRVAVFPSRGCHVLRDYVTWRCVRTLNSLFCQKCYLCAFQRCSAKGPLAGTRFSGVLASGWRAGDVIINLQYPGIMRKVDTSAISEGSIGYNDIWRCCSRMNT